MAHLGKNGNTVGKKKRTSSVAKPILVKTLVFKHKATAGQTAIDLTNLSTPSEALANGFVQASYSDIAAAKLVHNRGALELTSSLRGALSDFEDYVVPSSTSIQILDPAGLEEGEIITGRFKSTSDLLPVASKRIIKTYSLIVGQTTVNLAQEFKVGDNIGENIGAVKLMLGSTEIYRNTGNSSVVQDKDYYEVDAGNGYGTQIVLNSAITQALDLSADFGNRAITDSSALGTIEYLAGALRKLAVDAASFFGTSVNDYLSANPSEVERRTFGDYVLSLWSKFDTTLKLSEYTRTKFQSKTIAVGTTAIGVIPSLTFNNLVAGRRYRISGSMIFTNINAADDPSVEFRNTDGSVIGSLGQLGNAVVSYNIFLSPNMVFTAASNGSMTVAKQFGTGNVNDGSYVTLEELPNHTPTTDWT